METIITRDFLEQYREDVKEYAHYCKKIKSYKNASSGLEKNHFQKNILSAIAQYKRLKPQVIAKQKIIKDQISKIKKAKYRLVLTLRYVYHYKWSKIREILFSDAEDFEYLKDEKYKDKTFFWHRSSLECLKRTNEEEKTAVKTLRQIKKICKNAKSYTFKDLVEKITFILN